MGAVNTIVFEEDGRLSGHNTDGVGWLRSLEEATGDHPREEKLPSPGRGRRRSGHRGQNGPVRSGASRKQKPDARKSARAGPLRGEKRPRRPRPWRRPRWAACSGCGDAGSSSTRPARGCGGDPERYGRQSDSRGRHTARLHLLGRGLHSAGYGISEGGRAFRRPNRSRNGLAGVSGSGPPGGCGRGVDMPHGRGDGRLERSAGACASAEAISRPESSVFLRAPHTASPQSFPSQRVPRAVMADVHAPLAGLCAAGRLAARP